MRKIRTLTAALAAALLWISCMTAYAGDTVFIAPLYLNGLPIYAMTGSAGLPNTVCDAIRSVSGCDLAVLSADMFSSSLPEGPVTYGELENAVEDGMLIQTEVTAAELEQLLNTNCIYESPGFPQGSGFTVLARRSLTATGGFCGIVQALTLGDRHFEAAETAEDSLLYSLVTTERVYEMYGLPRRAEHLGTCVLDAVIEYMNGTQNAQIVRSAREERIMIVADTINANLAITKLLLNTPAPVYAALSSPVLIPDAVMYALGAQQRQIICCFPLLSIPYSLAVPGGAQASPATVDTFADVTMQVPEGRKTANTFSANTVFVDLRQNDTLPEGTEITVDLSSIYRPGMLLFLYSYDDNGDIIPMNPSSQIAEDGTVTFPIENGMTYVINDLELNRARLTVPSTEHPWRFGVVIVFGCFALWYVLLRWRRRRKKAVR